MRREPVISPNLKMIYEKAQRSETIELLLTDGRRVSCKLDCLTYANKSDDDDTDIMVALVNYTGGGGELLAEEDIEEVL